MRRLLSSKDPEWMRKLYQYLRQHGIPVSVTEKGEQLELWLHQSSYEALAKDLVQQCKANPELLDQAPTQQPSSAQSTSRFSRRSAPISLSLLAQSGWLTRVVAALSVLIFIVLNMWPEATLETLKINGSLTLCPLTSLALCHPAMHFTLLHIVFNIFWWWYLGGRIEKTLDVLAAGTILILRYYRECYSVPHEWSKLWRYVGCGWFAASLAAQFRHDFAVSATGAHCLYAALVGTGLYRCALGVWLTKRI